MTSSQTQQILAHLKLFGSITPMEALQEYGCFRLGARVWDLRQAGYLIVNEWEERGGKRYAKYVMRPVVPVEQLTAF